MESPEFEGEQRVDTSAARAAYVVAGGHDERLNHFTLA